MNFAGERRGSRGGRTNSLHIPPTVAHDSSRERRRAAGSTTDRPASGMLASCPPMEVPPAGSRGVVRCPDGVRWAVERLRGPPFGAARGAHWHAAGANRPAAEVHWHVRRRRRRYTLQGKEVPFAPVGRRAHADGVVLGKRGAGRSQAAPLGRRATHGPRWPTRGVLHVTDQEHPVRGGWAGRAPGRGRGWEERGAQAPSSPPPTPARPRWAAVGVRREGRVTRDGPKTFHSRWAERPPSRTGAPMGREGGAGPRQLPWDAGPRTAHGGPR